MDDLNACTECGFTTTDLHHFTQHVMEHEGDGASREAETEEADGEGQGQRRDELELKPSIGEVDGEQPENADFSAPTEPHSPLSTSPTTTSTTHCAIAMPGMDPLAGAIGPTPTTVAALGQNPLLLAASERMRMLANFSRLFNAASVGVNPLVPPWPQPPSIAVNAGLPSDEAASADLGLDEAKKPVEKASEQASPTSSMRGERLGEVKTAKTGGGKSASKSANGTNGGTHTTATTTKVKGEKAMHSCPICNFTTYMSQHMKSHLEAHERHQGAMYQCDICQMQFSQKANMHRHRMRHSGVKPYKCRFCAKQFFRKDQMQEHSMTHIKTGDDFDCPVADCSRQFSQHSVLRQHLSDEHVISGEEQANCKRCALTFSNSRRLLLHYQTKHDENGAVRGQKVPSPAISPEKMDFVRSAFKLFTGHDDSTDGSSPTPTKTRRRRISSKGPSPAKKKPANTGSGYNVEALLKAGHDNKESGSIDAVVDEVIGNSKDDGGHGAVKTEAGATEGMAEALVLPRAPKSPNCHNLLLSNGFNGFNSYPFAHHNDLFIKLASASAAAAAVASAHHEHSHYGAASLLDHDPHSHHMQLWTNESNSATTSTASVQATSSCSERNTGIGEASSANSSGNELIAPPSHPHSSHSATHSPTTSTSTNSSLGSTASSQSAPAISAHQVEDAQASISGSLLMLGSKEAQQMECCTHCGIFFIDPTLHLLHKGLHSDSQPFRCNLCGTHCSDKYTFTTHVINSDHS